MTDRVQLLKQESAALGGSEGDADPFGGPEPLDPQQDMPEVRGLYLQDESHRDERVRIFRRGKDLVFRDPRAGRVTLADLLGPRPCQRPWCRASRAVESGLRKFWAWLRGSR